jgi:ubiquinol-cytochrome c reductase cytochrome b subunit
VTHLIAVHEHGSSNPLGVDANVDRLPIGPHFLFKDLVTIFAYGALIIGLLSYTPNWLGHGDNYIPANPIVTPASIVPEWYLLPYYAVLRSVPNKLAGVFLILASLLILLILPVVDTHALRGSILRPAYRVCFWSLAAVFYLLFLLGAMHAEAPWTTAGQVLTSLYFLAFTAGFPLAKLLSR